MKAPFGPARHAGFFTLGIAIAVLVVSVGLAGGGQLLHKPADGAADVVAAESEYRGDADARNEYASIAESQLSRPGGQPRTERSSQQRDD
jgi:hypothetical protein